MTFIPTLFLFLCTAAALQHNITVDDTDSAITYDGPGWTSYNPQNSSFNSYNGTLHSTCAGQSSSPNSTATFHFTGVAIYFMAWPCSAFNYTTIILDGGEPVTVYTDPDDLTTDRPVLWSATGLSNGPHTIVNSAVNFSGEVDAFIYTVDEPDQVPPAPAGSENVFVSAEAFTFAGNWTNSTDSLPSCAQSTQLATTSDSNATFSFNFTGNQLFLNTVPSTYGGQLSLSINDGDPEVFDLTADSDSACALIELNVTSLATRSVRKRDDTSNVQNKLIGKSLSGTNALDGATYRQQTSGGQSGGQPSSGSGSPGSGGQGAPPSGGQPSSGSGSGGQGAPPSGGQPSSGSGSGGQGAPPSGGQPSSGSGSGGQGAPPSGGQPSSASGSGGQGAPPSGGQPSSGSGSGGQGAAPSGGQPSSGSPGSSGQGTPNAPPSGGQPSSGSTGSSGQGTSNGGGEGSSGTSGQAGAGGSAGSGQGSSGTSTGSTSDGQPSSGESGGVGSGGQEGSGGDTPSGGHTAGTAGGVPPSSVGQVPTSGVPTPTGTGTAASQPQASATALTQPSGGGVKKTSAASSHDRNVFSFSSMLAAVLALCTLFA
ncbi:hypothetical protein C8F01DRAFT_3123 [Mycena amicta]|nr:hypothetical protein C8F01DRAFT_3123 [Mycena amicta]